MKTTTSTTFLVKMRSFLMTSLAVALLCLGLLDVTVADEKCLQRGGTCQYTSNSCSGGRYWSGYCTGPSNIRCCIPGSVDDDKGCIKGGGHCQDETTSTCDGDYLGGYCAGGVHRKCCLPKKSPGGFSDNCFNCICEEEGCEGQVGKCRWDINSYSCGPFQIKEDYWTDCFKPGSGWRSCTKQMGCSRSCVRVYMRYWVGRCVKKAGRSIATCQDYARVHNGGPDGCYETGDVVDYWKKIEKCCQRVGGC